VALQVPRRLGGAAYVAAAADPTLSPEELGIRANPAATALYRLLRCVVQPFAATDDDQPSTLGLSTGQQLEQAGFLQALPHMLEATAQQLDTDCEQQRLRPAGTTDTAGSARHNTGQSCGPDSSTGLSSLHVCPLALLLLARHAAKLWPAEVHDSRIVPLLYPPVLRLANSTVRHLSACLEQLPADSKGPPSGAAVLLGVTFASADVACLRLYQDSTSSGCTCQPRVLAPDFLPCLCLLLTLASFATLLAEEHNMAQASTSRAGTSSSSRGRSRQQQQQLQSADYPWQLANSQQSCLPLAHDELLRQLGVGSRTALWAAATLACAGEVEGRDVTPKLLVSALYYDAAVKSPVHAGASDVRATGPEQQHHQEEQQQEQPGQEHGQEHGQQHSMSDLLKERQRVEELRQCCCPATQALHFLTASVLLHWAAHYPPSSEHYSYVCYFAVTCCLSTMAGW